MGKERGKTKRKKRDKEKKAQGEEVYEEGNGGDMDNFLNGLEADLRGSLLTEEPRDMRGPPNKKMLKVITTFAEGGNKEMKKKTKAKSKDANKKAKAARKLGAAMRKVLTKMDDRDAAALRNNHQGGEGGEGCTGA